MPASTTGGADRGLSREHFEWLRELIEERCGLHFDLSQRTSFAMAVHARMQDLQLDTVDEYLLRLRHEATDEEFRQLINLVTITSTSFFRDPSQFRLFRHHVMPTLLDAGRRDGKRLLRIWSAGCSSGEEVYSIALLLHDMGVYATHPDWMIEIVGTDLNTDVLERARLGVYPARALRNVEGEWLRRYFTPEGARFRVNDEIKRLVRFEYGNLTEHDAPSSWAGTRDVVFCKNVTIYFQPAVTRRLVGGFHHVLADGGFLLLGHSETLWQIADGFELVGYEGAFCYQKIPQHSPHTPGAPRTTPRRPPRPVSSGARPSAPAPEILDDAPAGRYERCLAAFRAGDWPRAETALLDLIRRSPTFAPACQLLAGVYLHDNRYEDAVQQAGQMLRLNDLDARAHLLLGIIAARQGQAAEALQALRRALYLDDALGLAHFWIGNLHRDRGDVGRACRDYENVLDHWERHTLDLTEEFALGMTAEELVDFCAQSVKGLESTR